MISILKSFKRILQRTDTRLRVFWYRITGRTLKLDIGAGTNHYRDWIATDESTLDITKEKDWARYFAPGSISNILAEHVFEHLTLDEARAAFANTYTYLKPGGTFRIAIPDGNHPSQYVIDLVRPGGLEPGADDHKVLYTIDVLTNTTQSAGFEVHPLEYFDADGVFHDKPYDSEYGHIRRSARDYSGTFTTHPDEMRKMLDTVPEHLRAQFTERGMSYTSLFVDLVKPLK